MNHDELPLTDAEETQLAFSLGLCDEAALEGTSSKEAQELRKLVLKVQNQAALEHSAPDPAQVKQLQAATRQAARPLGLWSQVEGSLRRSPWLRLVAASLVVHLAALPVLAWLHFAQPERPAIWIHFEEPAPALTSDPQPELLEPIELPDLLELIQPDLIETPFKTGE